MLGARHPSVKYFSNRDLANWVRAEPGSGMDMTSETIPSCIGQTLHGLPFRLPSDSRSDWLLIGVVGLASPASFLTSWRGPLRDIVTSRPGVSYVAVLLHRGDPLSRWLAPRRAKRLFPDPKLWPRTILTLDSKEWRNAIGWRGASDTALLLTNRAGSVVWQTREAASRATVGGLMKAL
jgi:hypothetical protein